MIEKAYRRKSDGKIAHTYASHIMGTDIYGKYYVISGEPANITQEEVDNTDNWELIEIDAKTSQPIENQNTNHN